MPQQYEAIRDKFLALGKSSKEAKSRAAAIYMAANKDNPSGRRELLREALAGRRKAKGK